MLCKIEFNFEILGKDKNGYLLIPMINSSC